MIVHRPFGELREELNGRKIVTWSEALSLFKSFSFRMVSW